MARTSNPELERSVVYILVIPREMRHEVASHKEIFCLQIELKKNDFMIFASSRTSGELMMIKQNHIYLRIFSVSTSQHIFGSWAFSGYNATTSSVNEISYSYRDTGKEILTLNHYQILSWWPSPTSKRWTQFPMHVSMWLHRIRVSIHPFDAIHDSFIA